MKRILLYTGRVSMGAPRCRAIDIAEHPDWPWPLDLPAEQVTKDDIVIMVKCLNDKLVERAGKAYVDIVDGKRRLHKKITNPNIGIIVQIRENIPEAKRHWFPKNEIIALPHAHANNERRERPSDREVKRIGYTGVKQGFSPGAWQEFASKIKTHGFEAVRPDDNPINTKKYIGRQREMCCDFYYGIDIAVAFRNRIWSNPNGPYMKGPTKLNNAGSFRIPTVAFPECAYIHNVNGPASCVLVTSIDEMVHACIRLRDDQEYYYRIADKAWQDAQAAHIDEVVKTYRRHFGV